MPSTESVAHDDLVLCACGNQQYTARDVIHAALFRGDLEAPWSDFRRRVEAEKRADETELELDSDVIDSAAEAFRYERDLITAEETEQWLSARGLTLDDFSDYFARQYCGAALADEISAPEDDYASATSELRQLFAADLMLSGTLDILNGQLIWRLAAQRVEKEITEEEAVAEENRFFERDQMDPAKLDEWLNSLGRDRGWLREMATLEAAFRRRCDTLLVPQSRQHELSTLRLPLTRFETEVVEVESRDAAQEAVFCIKQDGMSMEEVAAEARYPFRIVEFLLEDLPQDLQQKFMSTAPGEVLEPLPRGDGFELCRIKGKIEPRGDDPAVMLRVEQRLLNRHFSDLARKHVERRLGAAVVPG